MSVIGSNIKAARKHAGLTQAQLAQKAGMTKAAISRYESDLRIPGAEHLKAIATALETTSDALLGILPLKPKEMPLFDNDPDSMLSMDTIWQEYEAFCEYLKEMGYRTVIELRPDNPNCDWSLYDDRSGKKYYVSAERLQMLMECINSFAKFQIASLISECSKEKVPDATNIQD